MCKIDLRVDMKDIEFGKVIGRGNFAVVYRGFWHGKEVALKSIQLPSSSDLAALTTPKEVLILRYSETTSRVWTVQTLLCLILPFWCFPMARVTATMTFMPVYIECLI